MRKKRSDKDKNEKCEMRHEDAKDMRRENYML